MLVDAHCHLERATYGAELGAVMQRARDAGLHAFVAVGASGVARGAEEAAALAAAHPDVWAAVGIHPHEAAAAQPADMARIAALLRAPRVVCLGEVGLDYHYDNAPRPQQQAIFRQFLQMAHAAAQPIMLHIRDAHADAWAALDAEGVPARGGVVHCFTAGPAEAEAYLARGLHLSIPGVVTFKNAEPLRDAVREMPLERMLVETDCPYLAPVPHRGRRNEPAFVVDTARAVAALRGLSLAELGARTSANAARLFGLPGGGAAAAVAD